MSGKRTTGKRGHPKGLTLGYVAFAKVSAVEGIRIGEDLRRDLLSMERLELSPAERTRLIDRKYGKKSV